MTTIDDTDAITALLLGHQQTRRHIDALTATDPSPPADIRAAAQAWLDGPARAMRRLLEQGVFPALIESMAGSDAVCLRAMTEGLRQAGEDLDRRWCHTIRPTLGSGADPAILDAWKTAYIAYLERTNDELLPMAQRLLDDDALGTLDQAWRTENISLGQ